MLCLVGLCLAGTLAVRADTIEVKVNGLVCGFCAQGIDKILRENPATEDVLISLEEKLVVISTRQGTDIADEDLRSAITDAGYEVSGIERTRRTIEEIRRAADGAAKAQNPSR
jgi:copper chaperone CopZ